MASSNQAGGTAGDREKTSGEVPKESTGLTGGSEVTGAGADAGVTEGTRATASGANLDETENRGRDVAGRTDR